MKFVRAFFRVLVGVVFGVITALALSPAVASIASNEASSAPLIMPAAVLVSAVLAFFADDPASLWPRVFARRGRAPRLANFGDALIRSRGL